jgi:predicted SprT family Zn-dependent metalloprotease
MMIGPKFKFKCPICDKKLYEGLRIVDSSKGNYATYACRCGRWMDVDRRHRTINKIYRG